MAVTVHEALQIIDNLAKTPAKETLCLEEAVGRVAAKEYLASINLPIFDNSAMDGYAVRLEDAGKEVKVKTTILAGDHSQAQVAPGSAIKIMTGAKLPEGTEAIVPIEEVEDLGESVVLPKKIKERSHMRFAGEDIKAGEKIVECGEKLDGYKIGLLASQGISYVEVYRPLRVAVFATGHELKMHYESLQSSQIYNSNTPTLFARCKELGCEVRFLGRIEDDLNMIQKAVANALDSDLILTSGGVSVGEADFTKEAFKAMGMQTLFSKIDIKPGKPTTLGKIDETYVLNLPGNPLAASLNFEIFGRFLIYRLSGFNAPYLRPIQAKLKEKIQNKPGRDTVIPGFFDGEYFIPDPKRSPGMVSTMARTNGFVILAKDVEVWKKEVLFLPTKWNFTAKTYSEIITG